MPEPPAKESPSGPTTVREAVLTVAIPLFYPAGLVLMWFAPKNFGFGSDAIVYAGLGLGAMGLGLWITAMLHLGKSLDVLPGADQLVREGLYRLIRHPIYLGISLTFLGLVLCLGSVWGLVYVLVIILPLNFIRARFEDRELANRFNQEYKSWREATWF